MQKIINAMVQTDAYNNNKSQVRQTYVTKSTYFEVCIHILIRIVQVNRVPLYTYNIYSYIHSAWYELVPACNSSSSWNLSVAIRVRITTKLDFGREQR